MITPSQSVKYAFMSAEHVEAMNERLRASSEVATSAAELSRDYVLAYHLLNGPDGEAVHWSMSMGPSGVGFGLTEISTADVVYCGEWADMIRGMVARSRGEAFVGSIVMEGDAGVLETTAAVFALARAVAGVPVELPVVD